MLWVQNAYPNLEVSCPVLVILKTDFHLFFLSHQPRKAKQTVEVVQIGVRRAARVKSVGVCPIP